MDVRFTSAAMQAYSRARTAAQPEPASAENGFAKMTEDLGQALRLQEDAVKTTMISGSDPQALVEALAQTELAIETAVTLRDKVVEAYQEILRMPV